MKRFADLRVVGFVKALAVACSVNCILGTAIALNQVRRRVQTHRQKFQRSRYSHCLSHKLQNGAWHSRLANRLPTTGC